VHPNLTPTSIVLLLLSVYKVERFTVCRLWYMACLSVELGLDSDRMAAAAAVSPVEIGCVNVIPKCNEWTGKHPVYENMPETYAAINNYLAETPLEGIRFDQWLQSA